MNYIVITAQTIMHVDLNFLSNNLNNNKNNIKKSFDKSTTRLTGLLCLTIFAHVRSRTANRFKYLYGYLSVKKKSKTVKTVTHCTRPLHTNAAKASGCILLYYFIFLQIQTEKTSSCRGACNYCGT